MKTKAKRRGRGEGTSFQRHDGRWCAIADLGWENGRRKRKYLYAETQSKVQKKLLKVRSDHSRGLPVAVERQTVAQYLKRWLSESVKPSVRPLTYEQYTQHVRLYIEPVLGKIELSKLSAQHVQAFVTTSLSKKLAPKKPTPPQDHRHSDNDDSLEGVADGEPVRTLSPRTVKISLFVLRRSLDQAVKWECIARNVAKLVEMPRAERREIEPPTLAQAKEILNVIKGERFEAAFALSLALGLRRGEVLALRWADLDLDSKTLSVKQQLQRTGGKDLDGQISKLRFSEPKSRRSRRTISIPDFAADALRVQRARQAQTRLKAGSDWQDHDLVFTTSKGTPVEPRRFDAEFKRVLTNAKLPHTIRLHDSRHFALTLLAAMGVHPRTAMEIVGHSDINLTMNIYSHVIPELMREAAEKINSALSL